METNKKLLFSGSLTKVSSDMIQDAVDKSILALKAMLTQNGNSELKLPNESNKQFLKCLQKAKNEDVGKIMRQESQYVVIKTEKPAHLRKKYDLIMLNNN